MSKLTMTRGLPASGKSTWAKKAVLSAEPGTTVRINKDDLRAMLHAKRWSPENEKQILAARDAMIALYLKDGVDVIVDDTNLSPFHERTLWSLAGKHNAEFIVRDFTNVSLQECITRDANREDKVGEQVIREMSRKYLEGFEVPAI